MGDLTAMYDSNALALLPQLNRGTRVLGVINNGGGGIFRTLPGADGQPETMRKLLVQPHAHSFKAIAEQWGMRYLTIRTAEDFDQLDSLEENSQTLVDSFRSIGAKIAFTMQNTASQTAVPMILKER